MKYYLTQAGREAIQEADYTPDTEDTDARRRANTSDAAQSGKKPKMGGKFSDSPRGGEVRVPEAGVTLPKAKAKAKATATATDRVHPMRRLGQILGKMARISGSAPQSVDPTRRR